MSGLTDEEFNEICRIFALKYRFNRDKMYL